MLPLCSVIGFAVLMQIANSQESGVSRDEIVARRVESSLNHALGKIGSRVGDPVFIRIFKEERSLELWIQPKGAKFFKLFRTYEIAAMSGNLGPKLAEGDRQAPEGFYFVKKQQMNPNSRYHLAFNIGYPNKYDRSHGRTGSFIMVHGSNVSIGCYAMTDEKIEEIYTLCNQALNHGQPFFRVHSFPFRMTGERMQKAKGEQWFPFWQNLKEGYDTFEREKTPPNVEVRGGEYIF